ncbi:MAG: hypothetical protein WCR36_04730 [Bacteroidaceae bacterium]
MNKKFIAAIAMVALSFMPVMAGGLLTNTNLNASFLRMMARGASTNIYATYSNPAGLAFLPHDGLYLSIDNQSVSQTRDVSSTFAWDLKSVSTREFKGNASPPIVPSITIAFKQGDMTFSGLIGVTGGGGKATFDSGLPMFQSLVTSLLYQQSGGLLTPDKYDYEASMSGSQYIFGGQFGITYKVADYLSVYGGGRMNFFQGNQTGNVAASMLLPDGSTKDLIRLGLDVDQTGWGITPIIGAHFRYGKFNVGLKYEFTTNLNLENKENSPLVGNDTGLLDSYKDGVNTPNDIPGILSIGGSYDILPNLHFNLGYNYYLDKDAGMAGGKQKYLTHGTYEWLTGVEWETTDRLTLSVGYQDTNYGLSDDYQQDTSFSCDSYSVGFGARIKMNNMVAFNISYMFSNYEDYTAEKTYAAGVTTSNTFSRTNKVFGFGVEFSF